MPELPDIEVYVESLTARLVGHSLDKMLFKSPFVLRTALPPYRDCEGRRVVGVRRLAKRIVLELEGDLHLVFHLMKLGRFRWLGPGDKKKPGGKVLLATLTFSSGALFLIEMGTKKRASLHIVQGTEAVADFDPGGLEVLSASLAAFREAITRENHTLKRTLTDPRLLSGIGNAYSDEILHAAKLSPIKLSSKLSKEEVAALFKATKKVLRLWTKRLRDEVGDGFPHKVTAFRDGMAVHGRFDQPCPVCSAAVQRIVYADRETNYCPQCQTGGRPLADRGLSRLLGKDWPKTMEELEERRGKR